MDSQDNRFVRDAGRRFETLGFQAREPKAEAVSLPLQNIHTVASLVLKDEKHGIKHRDLDIQLDQGTEAPMHFRKSTGIFSNLRRDALAGGLQNEIGSAASGITRGLEDGVHRALKTKLQFGYVKMRFHGQMKTAQLTTLFSPCRICGWLENS